MKLQGLAVLFAIILLPIVIVTSSYVQTQIDTVVLEQRYDSVLMNATHDAIKAFQLNEINSNTDNIVAEKIRDIQASISTFYNSLGTGMGSSGYSEEDLKPYIPALVYNLYDGYYIYAPYENVNTSENNKEWGLKPYIYYSARYKQGSIDVTINYTLDNYITVYGWVNDDKDGDGSPDGWSYVTKSGYLINPNDFDGTSYKGVLIKAGEELREINEIQAKKVMSNPTDIPYQYIDGKNGRREKVYFDEGGTNTWYKYTVDRQRMELTPKEIAAVTTAGGTTNKDALEYYKEAKDFSLWVMSTLGSLTIENIQFDPEVTEYTEGEFFKGNTNTKIFDLMTNDPESNRSNFYNHKRDVIRNSIESNLSAVIASYNDSRAYNFKMPELTEQDWDKITNHVNMFAFMQGLPIKNKYYMGYTVVSNNMNREFVDPDSIYLIDKTAPKPIYHSVLHDFGDVPLAKLIGYRNLEFEPKSFVVDNTIKYYLPHAEQGDYDCIVSSNKIEENKEKVFADRPNIASAYYTALARERYNSYKSTKNFLAMLGN